MRVLVYSTGIVQNELCGYGNVVHTSSSFRPHTHTHTTQHTHTRMYARTHTIFIPFEDDHEPTGLKVDIAKSVMQKRRGKERKKKWGEKSKQQHQQQNRANMSW